MKAIQKVLNNVLSTRTISVLGPALYGRYLARFLVMLPRIARSGDLRPLDRVMGSRARQFRYRGSRFTFDCPFCDDQVPEDTFAFGIAREIYVRDCYFKWQPPWVYEQARNVMDLGANRGALSSLMTTRADRIVAVECQDKYAPVIRHNLGENGFARYAVEIGFVGAGGMFAEKRGNRFTIRELRSRHGMGTVDFLKIDIEGSEFPLFDETDWLTDVRAVSMEVHSSYGDPSPVLGALVRAGFSTVIADEDLRRIHDAGRANYIYAWKP
ncbi:MAG: FkbM family methyltransferase [Acidobacteriia bacterium]|nr:FkbM family methyltransferase [Terriglobia bacterium]